MNNKIECGLYIDKNRFFIDSMTDNEISLYKEIPEFDIPQTAAGNELIDSEILFSEIYDDKADALDCSVAAGCGTIAALLDIVRIDGKTIGAQTEWSDDSVRKLLIWGARRFGYAGNDEVGAINYLKSLFNQGEYDIESKLRDALSIELDDFGKHYSIVGLLFSILTNFTGKVYGSDENSNLVIKDVKDSTILGKTVVQKFARGILRWVLYIIDTKSKGELLIGNGNGIPKEIVNLFDKASSNDNTKLIIKKFDNIDSLVEKLSLLIEVDDEDNNNVISIQDILTQQAVPVLINECLLKSFIVIREIFEKYSRDIDTIQLIFKDSRRVSRMMLISTGVYSAINSCNAIVVAAQNAKDKDGSINLKDLIVNYVVNVNVIGVGKFAIACQHDGSYLIEDAKHLFKYTPENIDNEVCSEYANTTGMLDCFKLRGEQIRIQHSLMLMKIDYDIKMSIGDDDYNAKQQWRNNWIKYTFIGKDKESLLNEYFITDEDQLYLRIEEELERSSNRVWLYMVVLETELFWLYSPFEKKEKNKCKFKADYLRNVFVVKQNIITLNYLIALDKAFKKYSTKFSHSLEDAPKKIAALALPAAVVGVAGFVFAPAIAVALAGNAVAAGLSGAALTNASLAFFGGGAIASGGLGMAGGTAVISGGGAILGALGGGSGLTVANLMMADVSVAKRSCAEILTMCNEVYIGEYGAYGIVLEIKKLVEDRVYDLHTAKLTLKKRIKKYNNVTDKRMLEITEENYKQFKKTNELIQDILDKRK